VDVTCPTHGPAKESKETISRGQRPALVITNRNQPLDIGRSIIAKGKGIGYTGHAIAMDGWVVAAIHKEDALGAVWVSHIEAIGKGYGVLVELKDAHIGLVMAECEHGTDDGLLVSKGILTESIILDEANAVVDDIQERRTRVQYTWVVETRRINSQGRVVNGHRLVYGFVKHKNRRDPILFQGPHQTHKQSRARARRLGMVAIRMESMMLATAAIVFPLWQLDTQPSEFECRIGRRGRGIVIVGISLPQSHPVHRLLNIIYLNRMRHRVILSSGG